MHNLPSLLVADLDQGNSVCSEEGRGIKKVQVLYCIRVLRSVTASGDETVNQDLCDQGLINQLLGKLFSSAQFLCSSKFYQCFENTSFFLGILTQMEANPEEKDIVTIEIITDIQLILAVLCESDMHRKVNGHIRHCVFHI